jgi:hypothetical protein
MMTKQSSFLIFSLLPAVGFFVCNADESATKTAAKAKEESSAPDCDRACLEGFANQYLDAMVARDPARVPLAKNVKFTENGQELSIGAALWATASDIPKIYRIYLTDPQSGQVGFSGLMKENGKPELLWF